MIQLWEPKVENHQSQPKSEPPYSHKLWPKKIQLRLRKPDLKCSEASSAHISVKIINVLKFSFSLKFSFKIFLNWEGRTLLSRSERLLVIVSALLVWRTGIAEWWEDVRPIEEEYKWYIRYSRSGTLIISSTSFFKINFSLKLHFHFSI